MHYHTIYEKSNQRLPAENGIYYSKITNFGLKMMVKSGLEKLFLIFLHALKTFRSYLHKSEDVCPTLQIQ